MSRGGRRHISDALRRVLSSFAWELMVNLSLTSTAGPHLKCIQSLLYYEVLSVLSKIIDFCMRLIMQFGWRQRLGSMKHTCNIEAIIEHGRWTWGQVLHVYSITHKGPVTQRFTAWSRPKPVKKLSPVKQTMLFALMSSLRRATVDL